MKKEYVILVIGLVFISYSIGNMVATGGSPAQEREESVVGDNILKGYRQVPRIHYGEGSNVDVIIYSDYDCPYCKRLWDELEKSESMALNMTVKYYHLPIETIHPEARRKAAMYECIVDHGYDARIVNNIMFSNTDVEAEIYSIIGDEELPGVSQCFDDSTMIDSKYQHLVDIDLSNAKASGFTGTPTIVVGNRVIRGAVPITELARLLKETQN